MKLKKAIQVGLSELKNEKFDIFIVASGFEARSNYAATALSKLEFTKKVAFGFNNNLDAHSRIENDNYFKNNDFEIIIADSDSEDEINDYLRSNISSEFVSLNIVVDYSSMSRVWYAAILKYFYYKSKVDSFVDLYFVYSNSVYSPSPKEQMFNLHIGPIQGYSKLNLPQKPTALVIGLGYDRNRAIGLSEYFDSETFVFYTQDGENDRYSEEVERNNSVLLSQTKPENICKYSISDLNSLYQNLYFLCKDLDTKYRVILASCGPKTFTLVSLIISLEFSNIDVWRISAGKSAVPVNKEANGEILILKTSFTNSFSGK